MCQLVPSYPFAFQRWVRISDNIPTVPLQNCDFLKTTIELAEADLSSLGIAKNLAALVMSNSFSLCLGALQTIAEKIRVNTRLVLEESATSKIVPRQAALLQKKSVRIVIVVAVEV